jgi:hypothetical protein
MANLTVYKIGTDRFLLIEIGFAWLFAVFMAGAAGLHWALCVAMYLAGVFGSVMVLRIRAAQTAFTAVITLWWATAAFQITSEFDPGDWIAPIAIGGVVGVLSLGYHLRAFRYRREVEEV